MAGSKVAKCEMISQQAEEHHQFMNSKDITLHNLKPGFMVNAKVQKILDNGVELTFLSGFKGTVFADHLDRNNEPTKYKVGEKISARVIAVDPMTQSVQLSFLPHLKQMNSVVDSLKNSEVSVGMMVEKATVEKDLYGGSFRIGFGKGLKAFLHKTHTKSGKQEENKEEEEEEPLPGKKLKKDKSKKKKKSESEFEIGQKLDKLRIKEINYFDGVPIVSMKEDMLESSSLTYDNIKCGDFISAVVTDLHEEKKFVTLVVNEFVKGRLYLEHMADFSLKVIPPKYRDMDKALKVRVFQVDKQTRSLEFTRKESLLKAKTPVYQSYKEVSKGDKVMGVVVGENEHGLVVKTFGGIKCFLTFAEIKANSKTQKKNAAALGDLKFGSIVKGYVLFKKKDQGMALTLDKTKAKELREENEKGDKKKSDSKKAGENGQKLGTDKFENYLPTQDEMDALKEKYKTFLKASQDKSNIGKVNQFRMVEQTDRYLVCKSLDSAKKSQNFIALLPNILISKHFQPSFTLEDFTFKALTLEVIPSGLAVISAQFELIALKDTIPQQGSDISTDAKSRIFTGVVSESNRSGVLIKFLDSLQKLVIVKDIETVQNFPSIYTPGKVVRVALNKLNRLCLKSQVIYLNDEATVKADREIQIRSFYAEVEAQLKAYEVKIGDKVTGEISLVKDYGLIVSVEKYEGLTGFVLQEHQGAGNKQYKEGQKITCAVMDIDFEKEIVDLSERIAEKSSKKTKEQPIKKGSQQKAVVELNKEHYLIISYKSNPNQFGLVMCQSFNSDESENPNEKYSIGDEIDVQVIEETESGFVLNVPVLSISKKEKSLNGTASGAVSLTQGVLVTATIKSKRHDCIFLQIHQQSQLSIGRMHRIECQTDSEFQNFTVGESIQAKVLKISQGQDKKTFIELTRRKEHLKKTQGLDQPTLDKTYDSLESLKNGATYDALITDVNYAQSHPLQISLSPFVRGQISFDKIISAETLEKEGTSILHKFKPGTQVKVVYQNGNFGIVSAPAKGQLQKGQKVLVRYVKTVVGKGIAVQVSEKVFGFIDICEITDEILGDVCGNQAQNSPLFVARVIGKDKQDKPVLSARESVIDDSKWVLIGPEGKSVHFQKFDEKNQSMGNLRNKILKFTLAVAMQEGDLCLGYVTNIGKSGCFIQVGHQSTVRAGLNELSDESSYDFQEQMPLGRLVLSRVVKVEESHNGKRFNVTLRRSLVVFGTNAVDKSSLQEDAQVECIVLAIADGKLFAQVKGSYHKLKIKGPQKGVKVGDHVMARLDKVSKLKIKATFVEKVKGSGMSDKEQQIDKLWQMIEEEAQKDIQAQQQSQQQAESDANLIKNLGNAKSEIEEQINDLKELQEEGDDDEDMEDVQQDGSDEEEMQRIIRESKVYEDEDEEDEDEEDEEMEEDEEEGEDEDEEMEEDEDSDDEEVTKKAKSGKQSLKQRIKEEQEIRKKELQLKDNKVQPKSIEDFERLLVANKDQSYVWIQYIAFMIDKLGIESARKVAERAVKSVSISNEEDKYNLWVAFMNLENKFGSQATLEKVIKRALEVNDRKKIYLQLIGIYQASYKYQYIEDIYKSLCKKFNESYQIWAAYLEFLFQMREQKKDKANFLLKELSFSEPKQALQRALQSLPKKEHVNLISKFGQLEFKHGQPESGRTMFEGIVSSYPKRMDIWSVYMDMEAKYCGDNKQQARHLFERCLANEHIAKKPKKMKLVFQKYMEFESNHGSKKNVDKLRERVESYLETAFTKNQTSDKESDSE